MSPDRGTAHGPKPTLRLYRIAAACGLMASAALVPNLAQAAPPGQSAAPEASSPGAPREGVGTAPTARSRPPLPVLPKAPSLELPAPEPKDVAALDEALKRVSSEDASLREDAVREILEAQPRLVPAIDRRVNEIANRADREAMKALLGDTRKHARDDERSRMHESGETGKVVTPDYLDMLVRDAKPTKPAWQDLVRVAAMSRMLARIGTVEAARELVDVYVRFGEFLRVDTQLQLQKMGNKAVAALIEARRHRAEKISHWAERQLDALGKGIPGEAVNTTDYQVLADVLRAYGRVRDPDAARIVISFANSERAQVREAARQAVALFGDVASWQLRDAYETTVGKKPPRDWTWERTARELFGEYDRLRLSQVYALYEQGQAALDKRDYAAMRAAFDKVLARSPAFEHQADMAPAYLEYAKAFVDKDRPAAMLALYRAERIGRGTGVGPSAQSLLLTLQGEELLARGVADQLLFRRALELDASNQRAREVLSQIERGESKRQTQLGRYAGAGAIGAVALIAIAFIALRKRTRSAPEAPAQAEP